MNIWDILILFFICGAVAAALRFMRGNKKSGGCTCGCGSCMKDCPARSEEKSKDKPRKI